MEKQAKKDEPQAVHPFHLRGSIVIKFEHLIGVYLGGIYFPKYLSKRPWNAFPCLASSLAISCTVS